MFLGVLGGYVFGIMTGVVTDFEYRYGITYEFRPYNVVYALIKTAVFAFIITSVSAYHGYFTSGGAFSFLNLIIYLIERFFGREIARKLAGIYQVDYKWNMKAGSYRKLPIKLIPWSYRIFL